MHSSPTPAEFRTEHGDCTTWSSVDFEVYEHLVETQPCVLAGTDQPLVVGVMSSGKTSTAAVFEAVQRFAG